MWNRKSATTVAVIALLAASCGSESGVDTAGTVPETAGDAAAESIATESPSEAPDLEPIAPPSDIETDIAPDTEPTAAPEADPRWSAVLADARGSMIAGQCEQAISLFDELLDDDAWVATSSVVAQVRSERSGCADLVAIRARTSGAADTMAAYVRFLDQHPASPLGTIVVSEIRALYQSAGSDALSVATCKAVDGEFDLFGAPTADVTLACATEYASIGRVDDASALAAEIFRTAEDQPTRATARSILLQDPSTCTDLANGNSIVDPTQRPGMHASLLQPCMTAAADDPEQLARLQVAFLVDLPQHEAAATVEAALIDNPAACDLLPAMQSMPAFTARADLIVTKTFECAQFASFVGDIQSAIDGYESFLDLAPDDARAPAAVAGLAQNLIAEARQGVTTDMPRPQRSGSSGGGHAQLLFSNDTVYDQHVVVVGPEARIVTVEASSVSSTYAQRPNACRTDVPTVTIGLQPGTYEVMVYDDVAAPEIGSWTLESGAEYGWCAFYVRA